MIVPPTVGPLWGSEIQPELRSWRETSGDVDVDVDADVGCRCRCRCLCRYRCRGTCRYIDVGVDAKRNVDRYLNLDADVDVVVVVELVLMSVYM